MKQLLVLILIITTFFGCNNNENSCGQAYIGGEIINPNNDYLILYDDTAAIDTLYLDENNRFSYPIEALNPGLHSFVHGGEYQVVIIEPTDSIMIRLNTFDFDESLVFSGKGSKKNNYLINLFLSLEKDDHLVYELSKLEPLLFQEKLDSIKAKNYNNLNEFRQKHTTSELFDKVAKVAIDYNYYTHKELYPHRHFGMNMAIDINALPKSYFDFRKDIDYNDEELKDFYPYYNFLFPHFNNLALEKYYKAEESSQFNRNSIDYNLIKLEIMDELIQSEAIKNILLRYSTRNYLSNNTSFKDAEILFDSYMKKNTSKDNSEYITNLYTTLKRLQKGNKLPELEVLNYKNQVSTLNTVIEKPTVLYFWSSANKYHFKNSHNKVEFYKENHPDIDFISININSNNYSAWKRMLKQNYLDLDQEYRFNNPQIGKKLLAIHYINKVIITDKNGFIVVPNANMFDYDFKNLLNKLEQKRPLKK